MSAWNNWAAGVLAGISAPATPANLTSLWNWSNKESGADVMRWNNPLNTTESGFGGSNMNAVGVKRYPSVIDGTAATVATLLNGYYPNIVANLRASIPHGQWANAAANLNTWGTGTNWLGWALTPPGASTFPSGNTQEEPMNISLKRTVVRLAYLSMGREPESQEVLDRWANSIHDDGSNADAIAIAIADSPEAVAYRDKLHAVLAGSAPAQPGTDWKPFLDGVRAAWDKLP